MKKNFVVIFCLLVSSIYANDKKTDLVISQYKDALNLYKQKKYQSAYSHFNQLFEQNLNDANINFYLGRSAFELQKYHESIIAFDRVLFEKPDNLRAKLEIGRAYFMSKQFGQAKNYFEQVYNDPQTPLNIKKTLENFFAVIDQNTQKHFLNGIVLVGLNYDSNVKNKPKPTQLNQNDERMSDFAHQEVLILNYKYNINDLDTFKTDLLVFSKQFSDKKITDQNAKLISFAPAYTKQYENGLQVDYGIFADALWLDDDSNMRSFGVSPKLSYPLSKNTLLESSLKIQKKVFQNDVDKVKNSLFSQFNVGVKYQYNPKSSYGVHLVGSKEKENNDKLNQRVDINKKSYQLKLSSTHILSKKVSLNPSLSLKTTKNDDPNLLNNNLKQKDDEYKASLLGTYIYSPKWLFQLGADYTKLDSNLYASEYKKHTFTFNIIRPF